MVFLLIDLVKNCDVNSQKKAKFDRLIYKDFRHTNSSKNSIQRNQLSLIQHSKYQVNTSTDDFNPSNHHECSNYQLDHRMTSKSANNVDVTVHTSSINRRFDQNANKVDRLKRRSEPTAERGKPGKVRMMFENYKEMLEEDEQQAALNHKKAARRKNLLMQMFQNEYDGLN